MHVTGRECPYNAMKNLNVSKKYIRTVLSSRPKAMNFPFEEIALQSISSASSRTLE